MQANPVSSHGVMLDISHREQNDDCMDTDGRAEIIGVRVVSVVGTNSHVFDCMEAEDNNAERCYRGCQILAFDKNSTSPPHVFIRKIMWSDE